MQRFTDVLDRYNVPYKRHGEHHHSTQNWVNCDCPWCSPNWGKYRLGFEISTGRSNCWSCGIVNGIESLSQLCKIPRKEAASIWSQFPKSILPKIVHTGTLRLPMGTRELLTQHRKYLESRGFDPDAISRIWGVRGIGLAASLQWRLFIPIHDKMGQVVSWTTRSIGKQNPQRYISASSEEELVSHKTILYGSHLVRHAIVIVEGPLDVWAIGPGAAATCGIAFSESQVAEMIDFPIRVICFDSQDDAQKRAEHLSRQLSGFPGITENVVLETGIDPADADRDEIEELRAKYFQNL